MGSPEKPEDLAKELNIELEISQRERQREVEISEPFWMAETEVTVGQFRKFVEETGYKTDAERYARGAAVWINGKWVWQKGRNWRSPGFDQDDTHPVTCVSYHDAIAYCKWLSERTGKGFDLPTEAQWEYACRAGSQTRYPFGDDVGQLVKHANVADASLKEKLDYPWAVTSNDGHVYTAPVASFEPNAWGLYDMLGNVGEWTKDWFVEDCSDLPSQDPTGPDEGDSRVLRGGSWSGSGRLCRSAYRGRSRPEARNGSFGFRVAQGQSSG
ncbi:MAG: formylglycine-generating enzyme family protein [Pirellulaceae bacterium]|nr:formylglycine-generating enzyme family protein [Pirellulaceae bacterium]